MLELDKITTANKAIESVRKVFIFLSDSLTCASIIDVVTIYCQLVLSWPLPGSRLDIKGGGTHAESYLPMSQLRFSSYSSEPAAEAAAAAAASASFAALASSTNVVIDARSLA